MVARGSCLRCQLLDTVPMQVQWQDVVAQQPGPETPVQLQWPLYSCDPATGI